MTHTTEQMKKRFSTCGGGGAQLLSLEAACALRGRTIEVCNYGPNNKFWHDEFVVGDLIEEDDCITLLRADGTSTDIHSNDYSEEYLDSMFHEEQDYEVYYYIVY